MATVPKTGLAGRIRAWARERRRPFKPSQVCDGLGIAPGPERDKVRCALPDFLKRGEIERIATGRYRYNRAWGDKRQSPLKQKIFKAMYVSSRFAVSDIQRLTGQTGRCYIDRVMKELKDNAWLQRVARRPCTHGAGAETLWRIADPQRFRIEVME